MLNLRQSSCQLRLCCHVSHPRLLLLSAATALSFPPRRPLRLPAPLRCSARPANYAAAAEPAWEAARLTEAVANPALPPPHLLAVSRITFGDRAFFLLAFIAATTSIAFAGLVIAAVPTLFAMRRAAISLAKLADTAREELPSTMTAIRLSGMEISDLTLELSDLSQEIADGVSKSTQAVQAAEAGIRKIGSLARQQTMCAARKTSRVVGQAKKTFINMISRGESSEAEDRGSGMVES